ncbi:hypothetical protein ACFL0H_06025 [Thermodesulfobacteriota bacterium]
MDIRKRVNSYFEEHEQKMPWGFGVADENKLTDKAKAVWSMLKTEERLMISIHNPFKIERYKEIYRLNKLGLPQRILCELSGVERSTLGRGISNQRRNHE